MGQIRVGTGGWSDNDPPYNRLARYSQTFDFVEVNSTFYQFPPIRAVRLWRRTVPEPFVFAVKCSRIVTHEERLQPTERGLESLERMVEICNELRAKVLVLQTPRTMRFDDKDVEGFRDLLASVRLQGLTLGLDPGGRYLVRIPLNFLRLMEDCRIIHVVDLLKEEPVYVHEVLYSRLFGVMVSDDDLAVLLKRIECSRSREAYVGFHYLKMVDPALRLLRMLGRGMQRYL